MRRLILSVVGVMAVLLLLFLVVDAANAHTIPGTDDHHPIGTKTTDKTSKWKVEINYAIHHNKTTARWYKLVTYWQNKQKEWGHGYVWSWSWAKAIMHRESGCHWNVYNPASVMAVGLFQLAQCNWARYVQHVQGYWNKVRAAAAPYLQVEIAAKLYYKTGASPWAL